MRWAGVKASAWNSFAFSVRRHTVCLDILVLSLVVTVFWCMGSACRIYLHANFYISLRIKRLLWYMYCVSPDRRGESESRSERIYLFLCDCFACACVRVCVSDGVAESDTRSGRNRGGGDGDDTWLCLWYSFIYSYVCLSNLICSFRSSRKFLHLWFQAPNPPCPWPSEVKHLLLHLSQLLFFSCL